MIGPSHMFTAGCTACPAVYTAEVPDGQRSRRKAAESNREVWMQTHADTTGHTRFRVDESIVAWRIMSRGQGLQMVLSEDPNYSTIRL